MYKVDFERVTDNSDKFDFLDSALSDLFEEFLNGFSENTKIHYIHAIRGICLAKGDFLHLTSDDILDYFRSLQLAERTKSTTFYCLRSFSVFLASHIDGYISPFVYLWLGGMVPDYSLDNFPENELPDLFQRLGGDSDIALAVRLAIHMCLSVSELSNLQPYMFSFDTNDGCVLSIQRVKPTDQFDGISRLQVPDILIEPIKERMDREYIILNQHKKKISVRSLQYYLHNSDSSWNFQTLRSYGMLLKLQEGYTKFELAEYAGVDGRWLYRYNSIINSFPENELPDLFQRLGDDSDIALAVRLAIHMGLSVSELSNLQPYMFSFDTNDGCVLSIQRVKPTDQFDGISRLQVPDILIEPIKERMDREYIILNQHKKKISVRSLQYYLHNSDSSWNFQTLRSYGMLLKLQEGYTKFEMEEYAGVDSR